jgi:DNA-binding winged helix-turn-helix (wHTH) protein
MRDKKILTFEIHSSKPFSLSIEEGDKRFMLKHGDDILDALSAKCLEVLEYLAERSGRICSRDEILGAISPGSDHNLVDRYIKDIRDTFVKADPNCEKFIETRSGVGYMFLPKTRIEGDLGSIKSYSLWDRQRFFQLMKRVTRGAGDDGDIRITATGLGPGLAVLNFGELLQQRRLRIKVLFMNPANEPLIDARFLLRGERESSYERCLREQNEQISDLRGYAHRYPAAPPEKRKQDGYAFEPGELEFALSDSMPCGLVVHTLNWAIVGLFLAHTSYTDGPMIEIDSRSPAWTELKADWDARWTAAAEDEPKIIHRN